ncbi:MAG: NeuD/PglB/VioB family sugar acetyltransferase [Cyclobacteriaceae bacterium]
MAKPVLIFGANTLGKVALEVFQSNSVLVYGFLDDDKKLIGSEIDEVSILGSTDDDNFLKILDKKCDAFLAFDDNKMKKSYVKLLAEEHKVVPINAIHKDVSIARSAILHHGSLFDARVVIGPMAQVGNHCLIHASVIINAEAQIADYVQIGAGSIVSSNVTIAENVFIGAGVTIVSGVNIGKNARIGAGSVVVQDVEPGQTIFGNPGTVVK